MEGEGVEGGITSGGRLVTGDNAGGGSTWAEGERQKKGWRESGPGSTTRLLQRKWFLCLTENSKINLFA